MLAGIRLGFSHPGIKVSADGTCSLEDIIYHAVRCELYHESELDGSITFSEKIIGSNGTVLQIPKSFVTGLTMAVIGSSANSKQTCHPNYWAAVNGERFYLNTYWGKANKLRKDMAAARAKSEATAPTTT